MTDVTDYVVIHDFNDDGCLDTCEFSWMYDCYCAPDNCTTLTASDLFETYDTNGDCCPGFYWSEDNAECLAVPSECMAATLSLVEGEVRDDPQVYYAYSDY